MRSGSVILISGNGALAGNGVSAENGKVQGEAASADGRPGGGSSHPARLIKRKTKRKSTPTCVK